MHLIDLCFDPYYYQELQEDLEDKDNDYDDASEGIIVESYDP